MPSRTTPWRSQLLASSTNRHQRSARFLAFSDVLMLKGPLHMPCLQVAGPNPMPSQ
ncbi:hypothetical protein CGRA01v4_02392 [Colletotrichum graminicola]|nr:hypothetical protein CGRA01v4_02392 [Colletotrichum graminicola]